MSGFHPGAILTLLMIIVALQLGGLTATNAPRAEPEHTAKGARFIQIETESKGIAGFLHWVTGGT